MTGVYEIRASVHFSAAHRLLGYDGPCARMHGHNFSVEAAVTGSRLGPQHLLMDFCDLRKMLEDVVEPFDHNCLNEVEPFMEASPTSENVARHIYRALAERLERLTAGVRLAWVSVSESPGTRAVYREEA